MFRHRTVATVLTGAVPLLLTVSAVLTAGPAYAHGAPTDPLSRTAACGPEGGAAASTAACQAAVGANGGQTFEAWDNLRIADVNGRDRQFVPDGQLCSGGLDAYRGLDLARADWPATRLSPGAGLTLTYRTTIPHTGTFDLYLTREGYDPTTPLRWDDLAEKPFISVTDPPVVNGAYRLSGTLPANRTGRHVLYTVWRNTSTPDTYYSCSDVVFPEGSGGTAGSGDSAGSAGSAGQNAPGQPPVPTAPASPTAVTDPVPETPAVPSSPEAAVVPPSDAANVSPTPRADPSVPVAAASRTVPVSANSPSEYLPVAAGGVMAVVGIGMFVMLRRRAR
ncbi:MULTISPECIES: lytic polysaccharide monooxygenase [unclassified Streptomyces]|uniref:lytic polysaccharide monooxygenase auxiliary activity family 9 protein n=1 Tax=unclassified Streptomyces TaxID=2593676 RepID=UPI0037F16E65